MPAPTDDSEVRATVPICEACSTWVPPHSSRDQAPPISTTRTFWPYVSSNRARAPSSLASGSVIQRTPTGRSRRSARPPSAFTFATAVSSTVVPCRRVERKASSSLAARSAIRWYASATSEWLGAMQSRATASRSTSTGSAWPS